MSAAWVTFFWMIRMKIHSPCTLRAQGVYVCFDWWPLQIVTDYKPRHLLTSTSKSFLFLNFYNLRNWGHSFLPPPRYCMSDCAEKCEKSRMIRMQIQRPSALTRVECLCMFWLEPDGPLLVAKIPFDLYVYDLGQLRNSGWCWDSLETSFRTSG